MLVCRLLTCSRGLWAVLAVAGLLLCGGCGPGGYSGPTGTVSGTVTLSGEAVPSGCTVTFVSEQFTATGKVESGGSYKLSRVDKPGSVVDTIPVGTYQVSVTPPAEAAMSDADYDKMMEDEFTDDGAADAGASKEVIPAKYQTTQTSEVSKEVKEGPNTIKIELE